MSFNLGDNRVAQQVKANALAGRVKAAVEHGGKPALSDEDLLFIYRALKAWALSMRVAQ